MKSTSTVEVSIHAVLPVSRTGAAPWVRPSAGASRGSRVSAPRSTVSPRIPERITVVLLKYAEYALVRCGAGRLRLDRLGAGFPGAGAERRGGRGGGAPAAAGP